MPSLLIAGDLLNLWESALTQRPVQRALALLAIAYPELSREELQEFPIGRRDEALLVIREALFGPHLECLTTCPKCGERLEIVVDAGQLRHTPDAADPVTTYSIVEGDCELEFRLPNSADMLWIADLSDVTLARRSLFERCVQKAVRNGIPVLAADLPDAIVQVTAARMAEVDPQADIQIALTCPSCSQQWSTAFDIASYLWMEINAWAMRLIREIHLLASAYGWRESEILALSPMRRQLYLELIS